MFLWLKNTKINKNTNIRVVFNNTNMYIKYTIAKYNIFNQIIWIAKFVKNANIRNKTKE